MLIAISGPSCSGKTTLARALARCWALHDPSACITLLHQDDFFLPEAGIPRIKCHLEDGIEDLVNWDCPEALDMTAFKQVLRSFKQHGRVTDKVQQELNQRAKEDLNGPSTHDVSDSVLRARLDKLPMAKHVMIVDGFTLYHDDELISVFDIPFFIRGSHDILKARREARVSYATLEGIWQDPPGFFDHVVWREYVRTHGHLFEDGDVEGKLVDTRLKSPEAINPDLDVSFTFIVDELSHGLS